MSKSFSKLLLLFVFAQLTISCSDEELPYVEQEANYEHRIAIIYDCPLSNQNRITIDTKTYGRFDSNGTNCDSTGDSDNLQCFPNKLRRAIQTEFLKGPKGNSTQTNYTGVISNVLLSNIEDIPNLDLYHSIAPEYSNKLYRYIACEVESYLSSLPSLPLSQYYFPRVTYVKTDFTFSGPYWNNSLISFYYDVEIKSY